MRDAGQIERSVVTFAHSSNGGMIVTASGAAELSSSSNHHAGGAAQLPAVYSNRSFVATGGLISYGTDQVDHFGGQRATSTASSKALGLTIPETLLATADEVIQ